MKLFKSHFWYYKHQRNGVLFFVLLIVIFQLLYFFVDFSAVFPSDKIIDTNSTEIRAFQQKIDSLKKIALEKRKPKRFFFNPNYITDFKGYQLGMTTQEIDKLHAYRKQRKFVNSKKEFQQITKVSDSLLKAISPYFKFPDWVVKRNKLRAKKRRNSDFIDFSKMNFSEKVISEKKTEKNKLIFRKLNINTASFKELLKNPYINYELCKRIFEYRDEVAELQDISEIKNIDNFPMDKYERIVLYLKAE